MEGTAVRFEWWGEELEYADFDYNTTRLNERAVELPIAQQWLRYSGGRVMEVGNVLSHYYTDLPERTVVDRYEVADGVSNVDVFDVSSEWHHIVSISTLEHVRWDEEPREWGGSRRAIEHLTGLLSVRGRMLITVPLGCNEPLDEWLLDGDTGVRRACTLVRAGNEWVEGKWVQTEKPVWRSYGIDHPWAGSVWVGEWGPL